MNEKEAHLRFYLSPNDLVYVPTEEEKQSGDCKLYKMVSASGNQCFFVPQKIANSIVNKVEFSPLNKMEKSIFEEMIKAVCWKLEVDRLGNILKIIK